MPTNPSATTPTSDDAHTSAFRAMLVSTSDKDGGAGRAAYRLKEGLQRVGVDARMLAYRKLSDDARVHKVINRFTFQQTKLAVWVDKYPMAIYFRRERSPYWSLNWFPNRVAHQINHFEPQVVHLHWVGNGFLPITGIRRIQGPVVWTLHDMWAFTGGCHYSGQCTRYETGCGNCPQLNSHHKYDVSWITNLRKSHSWRKKEMTILTPSKWLAECARASHLFQDRRVEVIPNGLDLQQYKPIDKATARDLLNLPQDKKLVLAGANEGLRDKRKGVQYLKPALHKLGEQWRDDAELVVFGASKPEKVPDFGLPARYTGHLSDEISLALLYSAVDVFVAPSLQENLANTIMEALACGTPCIAFNIGGMPDMIDHCENGYLATAFNEDDLAKGIDWVLADADRWQRLSAHARRTVEERFELTAIAKRHVELYQELMEAEA